MIALYVILATLAVIFWWVIVAKMLYDLVLLPKFPKPDDELAVLLSVFWPLSPIIGPICLTGWAGYSLAKHISKPKPKKNKKIKLAKATAMKESR